MKSALSIALAVGALLFGARETALQAQQYSMDWYKIAAGGGMSTGAAYQVAGTIGQSDVGGVMTGAGYSLNGGFWSLISVVQTHGMPNLIMVPNGPNSVKILWPDPNLNTYTLQQNPDLAVPGGWGKTGYGIISANGTNSVIINNPTGRLFFRLAYP